MMDSHNLFMTRVTNRAVRLEYAAAMLTAVALVLAHAGQVRWWAFVTLFAVIDVVGYLPGALAWRRAKGGRIGRRYYALYNTMHSFLTAGLVAAVWSLVVGPEWALLALPIHLCGDRALFGNFYKPLGLSFEPHTHPAYEEFVNSYEHPAGPQPNVRDRRPVGAA
jgi:hypothetical protein